MRAAACPVSVGLKNLVDGGVLFLDKNDIQNVPPLDIVDFARKAETTGEDENGQEVFHLIFTDEKPPNLLILTISQLWEELEKRA